MVAPRTGQWLQNGDRPALGHLGLRGLNQSVLEKAGDRSTEEAVQTSREVRPCCHAWYPVPDKLIPTQKLSVQ
ncbi:Zinc Finger Ccch Domain-Containing Protein 3 [Manis pentadactyla]|nr:Zinc Finger Ccch Domain-Containing Protein 3 [Manis pentadactyla]